MGEGKNAGNEVVKSIGGESSALRGMRERAGNA